MKTDLLLNDNLCRTDAEAWDGLLEGAAMATEELETSRDEFATLVTTLLYGGSFCAGERGERFQSDTVKECLERWAELPAGEYENPLDDQDKLDEVRRAVFGSAPTTKKIIK